MMFLSVIVLAAVYLLVVFGINGLLLWGACWALNEIGINMIGNWTVEFSWALVVLFTIVEIIFKSIFKRNEKDD
jgi:hypothetical protein